MTGFVEEAAKFYESEAPESVKGYVKKNLGLEDSEIAVVVYRITESKVNPETAGLDKAFLVWKSRTGQMRFLSMNRPTSGAELNLEYLREEGDRIKAGLNGIEYSFLLDFLKR